MPQPASSRSASAAAMKHSFFFKRDPPSVLFGQVRLKLGHDFSGLYVDDHMFIIFRQRVHQNIPGSTTVKGIGKVYIVNESAILTDKRMDITGIFQQERRGRLAIYVMDYFRLQ